MHHSVRPRRGGVFASQPYRRLFAAHVLALVGTGLLTIALGLLAYDVEPRAAAGVVATALTIKIVAFVVLAPPIAAAADRVPRKVLLVGSDVIRAAVALSLPWVDEIWQIYLLLVVLQVASAAFTPAFQAVVPEVLPDERDYTRALSLTRLAYDMESLASPILASALLLLVPYHGLFVGTALGFVGSAGLVIGARLPDTIERSRRAFGQRLVQGLRSFVVLPELRAVLALRFATSSATALVLVNTVVVVRGDLDLSQTAVALTLAAFGGGSMVVALCVPTVLARTTDRSIMLPAGGAIAVMLGVGAVVLSRTPQVGWVAVLVVWLVLGAATATVLTPLDRVVTRNSSPSDRQSLFAAQFSLGHACFLLTYPLTGWLTVATSAAVASAVLAVVAGLASLVAVATWRRRGGSRPLGVAERWSQ